jgi:hypothetical protein
MSYGKMPPQAYTKETLQEAFEWWSEQTDDLRSQIQDKDDLVGYYLKSHGIKSYTPENSEGFTRTAKESFSSELKGLAKNLEDFEDYTAPSAQSKKVSNYREQRVETQPSFQIPFPDLSKTLVPASDDKTPVSSSLQVKPKANIQNSFFKLDAQSKETVRRAKEALNLSSEDEALRALISLGKSRIKSIF